MSSLSPEVLAAIAEYVETSQKVIKAMLERKTLTLAQKADFKRETDKIRENVAKPENQKPHKFEAAEWTHPNGHPRCIRCGEEESISGMCSGDMRPTGEDAQSGSRPAEKDAPEGEAKGDIAGHEFHGNRWTGGIGGGFNAGEGARLEIQKPDFYKTEKGRTRGLALQQKTLDETLQKFGITTKNTGANLKAEYQRSLSNGGKAEGMVWYGQAAEKTVGEICKMNNPQGRYYSRAEAVAMVAATSPQNPWDDLPNSGKNAGQRVYPNLALARACAEFVSQNPVVNVTQDDADRFNSHPAWLKAAGVGKLEPGQYQVHPDAESGLPKLSTELVGHVILQPGFGLQGLPEGATKALNIALGEEPEKELSGDKVRNFFTNLMNPGHGDAVTVDTWMARIAVGKQVEGYYEAHPEELGTDKKTGEKLDAGDMGKQAYLQLVGSHAGYEWVANQIRAQAKAANILPQQFQAATWVSARIEADKEKAAARAAARGKK